MKTHTTLTIDGDLLKAAKREGYNISELLEKTLRDRAKLIKEKEKESDEVLSVNCDWCAREVVLAEEPFYICELTRKGACKTCEDGVVTYESKSGFTNSKFIVKCDVDREGNITKIPIEHEHKRFGKLRKNINLQTLKEIADGKPMPGTQPMKAVEPAISAPF